MGGRPAHAQLVGDGLGSFSKISLTLREFRWTADRTLPLVVDLADQVRGHRLRVALTLHAGDRVGAGLPSGRLYSRSIGTGFVSSLRPSRLPEHRLTERGQRLRVVADHGLDRRRVFARSLLPLVVDLPDQVGRGQAFRETG